jgi:hypothetical protein
MAKSPAVQIVNDAEVPAEVLASSIVTIAEGVRKLRAAKLGDRALFLLIQDACPERIGLDKIRMIFDAAGELDKRYIRKPK